MMEAMVASALRSAEIAEKYGLRPRSHYPERESQRRPGLDRRIPVFGIALRLSAASRLDRSRHGSQGHRRFGRRTQRSVARRHRRHHSRVAHARARWRPHGRSLRRSADSAVHGLPQLRPASHRLSRLRTHHQHIFPGNCRSDSDLHPRADADLARTAIPA